MNFYVLPYRITEGEAYQFKKDAEIIYSIVKDDNLWFQHEEHDGSMSLGLVYYLEKNRKSVLMKNTNYNCDDFFIVHTHEVNPAQIEKFYEFSWRENHYYLIKFNDCNILES